MVHHKSQRLLYYALLSFVIFAQSVLGRSNRFNRNAEDGTLSQSDEDRLAKIYGRDVVSGHRNEFISVGQREPPYHPIHPPQFPTPDLRTEIDQVRLLEHKPLTPGVVKDLLRELLDRLEGLENGGSGSGGGFRQSTTEEARCSLHGLWISAITGVAFQLEPSTEHSGLKVQVLDAGASSTSERIITSEWSGTAQVSTIPTTISIILQERAGGSREPKSAVFVGQCVICSGSPTIQGTWIIFPETQVCFQEGRAPQADIMYLLKRDF